jgi:predicted DNA-binding transcriptional regulator AlpA
MTGFLSIKDFCALHALTRSTFYRLLGAGTGPRITKLGKRTLISQAAAAEWCQYVDGKHTATTKPQPTLREALASAQGARR